MPHRSTLPFSHPTSANSFLVIIPHSLLFNLFTFCHEQEPSAFSWADATTYFFDLTEHHHRLVQPARWPQPTWKPNFWYLLDRFNFHVECDVKSLYSHKKKYSQFVLHLFSQWLQTPKGTLIEPSADARKFINRANSHTALGSHDVQCCKNIKIQNFLIM